MCANRECENIGGGTEPETAVSPCAHAAQVRFRFGKVDWSGPGPGVFDPMWLLPVLFEVKTDLPTRDLVTLAFRNSRGDTKVRVRIVLWPMGRWAGAGVLH